ncbi:MAG: fibronectin type III domain-containing protein, partial [Bacilli bacterium]|nr:fibronectin type III domain-containing protein [Bacilli bacterium]
KKPVVNTVTISNITTNSFKVTATAQAKENGASISTYEFSKDGGSNWTTPQASNEYTFTDLTPGVEFNVQVRVTDSNNRKSDNKAPDTKPTTLYENPSVTNLTISDVKYNGFKATATATAGTAPIKNYYFSVSTDKNTWTNESAAQTTNSYTFTDLSSNTSYYVKVRVVDNNNKETSFITTNTTTTKIDNIFANKIMALYTTDGTNNLYKHDGSGNYTNAAQESGGGEYRFAGPSSSTNNYVCFGSKATTCPNDNLYRIIGVFGDRVKLIKSDYADSTLLGTGGDFYQTGYYGTYVGSWNYKGSLSTAYWYYWNKASGTNKNTWSDSQLNKIHLNTNFINNIGTEWANLIDTTEWNVGGMTSTNGYGSSNAAKTAYNYEVGANKGGTPYSAKVGMVYLSDYYYAASPTYWSTKGSSYNNANTNNWMHLGAYEWTISSRSDNTSNAFYITESGTVGDYSVYDVPGVGYPRDYYLYSVRPSFYLKSDVITTGGTGTSSSPYRVLN